MSASINPERKGLIAGAAFGVLGLLLLTVPSLAGMDGFDGGFALGLVGLMLTLLGAITLAFMVPRARAVDRLLSGQDLLAHWGYDEPARQAQVVRDRSTQLSDNRRLLLIVLGWWVLSVVVFLLIGFAEGHGDDMPLFIGLMAGVLAIVAAAGLGIPYLRARSALRSAPEAYIGRGGVLVNGTYHPWRRPWSALSRVTLEDSGGTARLVFYVRALTGPGFLHWVPYKVEVPVPPNEAPAAERILAELDRRSRQPDSGR